MRYDQSAQCAFKMPNIPCQTKFNCDIYGSLKVKRLKFEGVSNESLDVSHMINQ